MVVLRLLRKTDSRIRVGHRAGMRWTQLLRQSKLPPLRLNRILDILCREHQLLARAAPPRTAEERAAAWKGRVPARYVMTLRGRAALNALLDSAWRLSACLEADREGTAGK